MTSSELADLIAEGAQKVGRAVDLIRELRSAGRMTDDEFKSEVLELTDVVDELTEIHLRFISEEPNEVSSKPKSPKKAKPRKFKK